MCGGKDTYNMVAHAYHTESISTYSGKGIEYHQGMHVHPMKESRLEYLTSI